MSYAHSVLIVIASPVTRRKYIPIGSTATSMSPTVTGTPMPILTNPLAARLAKKLFAPKFASIYLVNRKLTNYLP
ncbi:hypothetical protein [Shewanella putrefaciens]